MSRGSGSRIAGRTAVRTGSWRGSATPGGRALPIRRRTAANGGNFGRSSDPWVSWAPNGDLWSISLSFDATTARNAVLAARMRHGTPTWSEPFTLKFDESRTGVPEGTNFNDKESLTADPTDPSGNLVYAVWDRKS